MGDAKRRGSFEQRKANAISRQKLEAEYKAKKRREIEMTKTPEQKLKGCQAMMKLMMLLGVGEGYSLPHKFKKGDKKE